MASKNKLHMLMHTSYELFEKQLKESAVAWFAKISLHGFSGI